VLALHGYGETDRLLPVAAMATCLDQQRAFAGRSR
jgi:hypothetical protein